MTPPEMIMSIFRSLRKRSPSASRNPTSPSVMTPGPRWAVAVFSGSRCKSQLATIKCPRSVDFEAELPRLPTGKLYKRLLRDKYWEGRNLSGTDHPPVVTN